MDSFTHRLREALRIGLLSFVVWLWKLGVKHCKDQLHTQKTPEVALVLRFGNHTISSHHGEDVG